ERTFLSLSCYLQRSTKLPSACSQRIVAESLNELFVKAVIEIARLTSHGDQRSIVRRVAGTAYRGQPVLRFSHGSGPKDGPCAAENSDLAAVAGHRGMCLRAGEPARRLAGLE